MRSVFFFSATIPFLVLFSSEVASQVYIFFGKIRVIYINYVPPPKKKQKEDGGGGVDPCEPSPCGPNMVCVMRSSALISCICEPGQSLKRVYRQDKYLTKKNINKTSKIGRLF